VTLAVACQGAAPVCTTHSTTHRARLEKALPGERRRMRSPAAGREPEVRAQQHWVRATRSDSQASKALSGSQNLREHSARPG
jgi:hypothetical protein